MDLIFLVADPGSAPNCSTRMASSALSPPSVLPFLSSPGSHSHPDSCLSSFFRLSSPNPSPWHRRYLAIVSSSTTSKLSLSLFLPSRQFNSAVWQTQGRLMHEEEDTRKLRPRPVWFHLGALSKGSVRIPIPFPLFGIGYHFESWSIWWLFFQWRRKRKDADKAGKGSRFISHQRCRSLLVPPINCCR